MEPGVLAALAAGFSAMLGAWAAAIRLNARIAQVRAEDERSRNQWEQETIDRQREALVALITERDEAHSREVEILTARVADLEAELKRLRNDLQRRDEEIARVRAELDDARRRIHQLELDNAKLDAQKTALIEQNALLREQNAELYRMASDWNAFARKYIVKPGIDGEE